MSQTSLAFVVIVSAVLLAVSAEHYCTIVTTSGSWQVLRNPPSSPNPRCANAVLTGEYNATLQTIGWDVMRVVTSNWYSDEQQAYAVGFFEGTQTYVQTMNMYNNQIAPANLSSNIAAYFEQNAAYIASQSAAKNATDPYWFQVGLVWAQFRGMLDGLNSVAPPGKPITLVQLMTIASQGDLLDLTLVYPSQQQPDWRKMSKGEFALYLAKRSHCSALVRVTPTLDNIFFGHATWQSFTFAIRIFKTVTLNFKSTAAKTMQYSSYPGTFSSTDDFYTMDSGLAVLETSLNVFNTSIYVGNIKPTTVLSWMRALVANRMATSGPQWLQLFQAENSGTYNNEWLVLNLNLFTPGQDLLPNTLWVVDQMPGMVVGRDFTTELSYGFFPSYNVPVFRSVFEYAGYPSAIAQQGPSMLDYQMCVRAQIFRQQAPRVQTMSDFQNVMQFNHYETNSLQQGNPGFAIASRFDLTPPEIGPAQTFGAIDAKVTDVKRVMGGGKMEVLAFAGPTPQQPQFSFLTTKAQAPGPYVGVPLTFNFTWQSMTP